MTKILMLVNWKVEYCRQNPTDKQPPDFVAEGQPYWFYRYFKEPVQVDVLDVSSLPVIERFEREKLRFYVLQALRAIPRLHKYDLVVSHGMQSGVAISLWRRFFPGKVKHVVFDIGSFNSAAESGVALRMMQFASRSIEGVIYHTSTQKDYYEKCFPWIVPHAQFIRFGTDSLFFRAEGGGGQKKFPFILCVGYDKRDWDTLIRAYALLTWKRPADAPVLKLIGREKYQLPEGVELPEAAKLETLPYIPVRQLMEQIQEAAFCVLPLESFNYSFGQMTLLQQMALGKAVIVARVPSMLDYVQDGKNALFYETGNENDLCEKMQLLLDNVDLCKLLGKQAGAYVREEHNEKDMALQIEAFYRKVLKEER